MNGFEVHVSESDFKAKSPEERDLVIYKAIEGLNQHGCQWSRKRHRVDWRNTLIILAVGVTGFYEFWSHFLCK